MKLPVWTVSLGSFLLACGSLVSLARGQDVAYEKYELDNGMTVILHEDHSLPVACINLWYYVGSKDELPGRSGFAHLFEHLMFMGTERVPGSQFDEIMEAGGGWNNASTSQDRTNYFSFGPSQLLPLLLWLDADRLEDLGRMMTQEKLDKQRDVVRNERRQTTEMQPYGKADFKVTELMYPPGHPYHIEVIGTHEDLQAATLQNVKDFFATFYVPNNVSLVVAGDFDPAEVKPLIAKLFGTLPRGADPVHARAETVLLERAKRVTYTDQVQFGRLSLVYHSPEQFQPGDAEMSLAGDLLSSGKSSRLYQRLIYQDKLATDVSARQASSLLGSLFTIEVTAREGVSLDVIEKVADEVIEILRADGPSEEELERHKASVEYEMLSRLQSILGKADQLNEYNFFFGEPNSFRRDLERYRQATAASVREWVLRVLDPGARLIMKVLPETEGKVLAGRDEAPGTGEPEAFRFTGPTTFKLSNGIEVRHWYRPELPLVAVSLLLRGGAVQFDAVQVDGGRAGCTALAAEMLDEGAGERDAIAFSDALDLLGARFIPKADREAVVVGLSVLERHLDEALDLYADAILRPRFDAKEWERVKTLHIEALERANDRPSLVAARVGMREFFGKGHPYSQPVEGTVASVGALSLDVVKGAYERLALPRNAVFFVAGDISHDEARQALEVRFGNWNGRSSTAPLTTPVLVDPQPKAMRVVLIDRPGSVQTVIRFFMPAPRFACPDRVELELLNTLLGGSFTSRLNQNLRERHGFTYGARSRFAMEPHAGYLMAWSDVQTEVTGRAIEEFLNEFGRMRAGDITAQEAAKARETNRVDMIDGMQGLSGLLSTAVALEVNGAPFSTLDADLAEMAAVSEKNLNSLAARSIPVDRALLVLMGDKAAILEQVKSLNLPAPQEVMVEE
ncbi:MAG: pitrilysin family protein [Planctomycetota bacterium]